MMHGKQSIRKRVSEFPWRAVMLERPHVLVAGILVSAVIAIVTAFYLDSEANRSYEQSRHAAESIATVFHHHIDRDFAKIGIYLRMIRNDHMLERDEQQQRVGIGTSELFGLFPEIEALVICDANGQETRRFVRTNSDRIASKTWLAAYEKPAPMSDIGLAGPFRSPYTGQWVITLAIDLVTRGGQKDGYAFVSIQSSSYFASILSQPELGQHGAATVRKQDLALVYRSPLPNDDVIGTRMTSLEIQDSFRRSPNEGTFIAKTAIDGVERVNAYRRIGTYPLYIVVGLATSENLKHWRLGESLIAGLAGLSIVLLLALSLIYAASVHRQYELNARLSSETEKLSAIFEACSEGIHILDLHGGLIKANTAFYRLIGRDEHEAGINMTDWSQESRQSAIERFHALPSAASSETRRLTSTFFRKHGEQLQVEIGIRKFDYDGQPAICASARDITAEKGNLAMLHHMLSEYRQLNDELEFRARCCEVIHEQCQPCLAGAIPAMLADWQELLLVFGAMRESVPAGAESDLAALMERARQLLDTFVEIVHRAHLSSDFSPLRS